MAPYPPEIENFASKYMSEIFTAIAVIIGTLSSAFHFFTGADLTMIFFAIGICLGIFLDIVRPIRAFYALSEKNRMAQVIWGSLKAILGIFLPFVLFFFIGMLAGSAHRLATEETK